MPNSIVSDDKNQEPTGASGDEGKDEQVSRDAYDRAVAQRKADKVKREAAERERDELKAKLEEQEQAKLNEQNEFKTLYEKEKKKREEAESKLSEMTTSQITNAKKQALNQVLGGTLKSEYLVFAKLGDIEMNEDGSADLESVKRVAAAFKASHPELVPVKAGSKLPKGANDGTPPPPPKQKTLEQMTQAELRAEYKRQEAAKQK